MGRQRQPNEARRFGNALTKRSETEFVGVLAPSGVCLAHCSPRSAAKHRGLGRTPVEFQFLARISSWTIWGVMFWLCFSIAPCFAQEKAEIPRGYEDAPPAKERAAARPAAAARVLPAPAQVQVLAPAVAVPLPAQAAPAGADAPVWRVAPAARAAPAEEGQSVLELLTDALGEEIDPNVRNLENRYLPLAEQLLTTELAFVKRVCQPEREQYEEIATATRGRVRPAVREYAVALNRIQRGRARAGDHAVLQPGTVLQKEVAAVLKAKLRPDQVKQYEEECTWRTARRRRAVAMNLVVKLDEELGLTPEQRAKLIESLTNRYQENWEQWLQIMQHNPELMPQIPNDCVLTVLNREQRDVWMRLSKSNVSFASGGFLLPPIATIEEDVAWEGPKHAR